MATVKAMENKNGKLGKGNAKMKYFKGLFTKTRRMYYSSIEKEIISLGYNTNDIMGYLRHVAKLHQSSFIMEISSNKKVITLTKIADTLKTI